MNDNTYFVVSTSGLSSTPVGNALAEQVANSLDTGYGLSYYHRDYCGMGICKEVDNYLYGPVRCDGGAVISLEEVEQYRRAGDHIEHICFSSRTQFVRWLREQSDESLHGDGNQRVTIHRLKAFVASSRNRGEG